MDWYDGGNKITWLIFVQGPINSKDGNAWRVTDNMDIDNRSLPSAASSS
jgi:hypothetical protein